MDVVKITDYKKTIGFGSGSKKAFQDQNDESTYRITKCDRINEKLTMVITALLTLLQLFWIFLTSLWKNKSIGEREQVHKSSNGEPHSGPGDDSNENYSVSDHGSGEVVCERSTSCGDSSDLCLSGNETDESKDQISELDMDGFSDSDYHADNDDNLDDSSSYESACNDADGVDSIAVQYSSGTKSHEDNIIPKIIDAASDNMDCKAVKCSLDTYSQDSNEDNTIPKEKDYLFYAVDRWAAQCSSGKDEQSPNEDNNIPKEIDDPSGEMDRWAIQCSSGRDQQSSNEDNTIPKEIDDPSGEMDRWAIQCSSGRDRQSSNEDNTVPMEIDAPSGIVDRWAVQCSSGRDQQSSNEDNTIPEKIDDPSDVEDKQAVQCSSGRDQQSSNEDNTIPKEIDDPSNVEDKQAVQCSSGRDQQSSNEDNTIPKKIDDPSNVEDKQAIQCSSGRDQQSSNEDNTVPKEIDDPSDVENKQAIQCSSGRDQQSSNEDNTIPKKIDDPSDVENKQAIQCSSGRDQQSSNEDNTVPKEIDDPTDVVDKQTVKCSSGRDQQSSNEDNTIPKKIDDPSDVVDRRAVQYSSERDQQTLKDSTIPKEIEILTAQSSRSDSSDSDRTSVYDAASSESRRRGEQSMDQLSERTVNDIVASPTCSQEVMDFDERQSEIFEKLIEMKNVKPDEITERDIIYQSENMAVGSHTLKYEKKGKPFAKGTYGSVYSATLETPSGRKKDCVVKQISFEKFNVTEAFIPLVMGEQIPQVPELHAIIREKDNFMIFVEQGLGGTLKKHERTWATSCIVSCLFSVLCGLLEMHLRLGAHFDIKYCNIGFWKKERDPRHMAIFDYGSYKADTDPELARQTINYTVDYLPPEFNTMHRDKRERHFAPEYFKFDVWALAVTVAELLLGKPIWNELIEYSNFKKANDRSHKKTIAKGKFLKQLAKEGVKEAADQLMKIPVENDQLKQQLVDLLLKMLKEPRKRIKIQDALNHPVFDLPMSDTVHVKFVIDKETTVFEEIVPKGTTIAECLARPYIPSEVKEATRYLSSDDKDVHIFESDMSVYVKK